MAPEGKFEQGDVPVQARYIATVRLRWAGLLDGVQNGPLTPGTEPIDAASMRQIARRRIRNLHDILWLDGEEMYLLHELQRLEIEIVLDIAQHLVTDQAAVTQVEH